MALLKLGINVEDFSFFTIGELIDLLITQNNQYEEIDKNKKEKVRKATQSDFDKF